MKNSNWILRKKIEKDKFLPFSAKNVEKNNDNWQTHLWILEYFCIRVASHLTIAREQKNSISIDFA